MPKRLNETLRGQLDVLLDLLSQNIGLPCVESTMVGVKFLEKNKNQEILVFKSNINEQMSDDYIVYWLIVLQPTEQLLPATNRRSNRLTCIGSGIDVWRTQIVNNDDGQLVLDVELGKKCGQGRIWE